MLCDLSGERPWIHVLEHAVVVSEPGDVHGLDAERPAGSLFFGAANLGETLVSHGRIARTRVVACIDEDVNVVTALCEQCQGAAGGEGLVIWMGRYHQDLLPRPLLDSIGSCVRRLGLRNLTQRRIGADSQEKGTASQQLWRLETDGLGAHADSFQRCVRDADDGTVVHPAPTGSVESSQRLELFELVERRVDRVQKLLVAKGLLQDRAPWTVRP